MSEPAKESEKPYRRTALGWAAATQAGLTTLPLHVWMNNPPEPAVRANR